MAQQGSTASPVQRPCLGPVAEGCRAKSFARLAWVSASSGVLRVLGPLGQVDLCGKLYERDQLSKSLVPVYRELLPSLSTPRPRQNVQICKEKKYIDKLKKKNQAGQEMAQLVKVAKPEDLS